jgi:hypothetical protein
MTHQKVDLRTECDSRKFMTLVKNLDQVMIPHPNLLNWTSDEAAYHEIDQFDLFDDPC